MAVYLIKRGPRPAWHRAPWHPVILCDRKPMADWEAGWSGDGAWVWVGWSDNRRTPTTPPGGWLLTRWNGLVIDYGHIVRGLTLPDGSEAAFWRHYPPHGDGGYVGDLLPGAVWWSSRVMPAWLAEMGVVYPADDFTQQDILDLEASVRTKGGAASGVGRKIPPHWPQDPEAPVHDGREAEAWDGFIGGVDSMIRNVLENIVVTEVGGTHVVQLLPDSPASTRLEGRE